MSQLVELSARWRRNVLLLALLSLGGVALLLFVSGLSEFAWVNHDTAFFLYLARKLAEGSKLYIDWQTVNPPSLVFASGLCGVVAGWLGVSVIPVYHVFVLLLAVPGLLVLYRALADEDIATWGLVASAYVCVAVAGNVAARDFGQREHLFAILFLPYLFWRFRTPVLSPGAVCLLVLLGYFALMKPQFVALVVVSELLAAPWRRDASRPWLGWAAFAAGGASVAGLLWLHSPDSFAAFVTEVVPMHLRGDYAYESRFLGWVGGAENRWMLSGLALLAANVALSMRRDSVDRRTLRALAVLPLLAYASVIQQSRFYSYHVAGCFAMLVVFNAYLLGRLTATVERPGARRQLLVYPGLCLALLITATLASSIEQFAGERRSLGRMMKSLAPPGTRVMVFSPSLDFAEPALRLDLDVAGPWLLRTDVASILALEDEAEQRRALAATVRRLAVQIDQFEPELLFFSPSRQSLSGSTLHMILVNEYGLLPAVDYERISSDDLHRCCQDLYTWRVYRRIDSEERPAEGSL